MCTRSHESLVVTCECHRDKSHSDRAGFGCRYCLLASFLDIFWKHETLGEGSRTLFGHCVRCGLIAGFEKVDGF